MPPPPFQNTIYSCENIQISTANPFDLVGCFGRINAFAIHHQVAQSAGKRQATGYSRSIFNIQLHIHSQWLSKGQKSTFNSAHRRSGSDSLFLMVYNGCPARPFLCRFVKGEDITISLFSSQSLCYHASFVLLFSRLLSKVLVTRLYTSQTLRTTSANSPLYDI